MSDDRDRDLGPEEDERLDASDEREEDGLGLTEEFARIESEIESEIGGSDLSDGDDHPAEEPLEPGAVRWDDTDSSEWVAPVPPRADSGDTGEWAAEAGDGPAEETDVDPEGGEADPPDPEEDPASDEADPPAAPEVEGPDPDAVQDPPTVIGKVPDGVHGDGIADEPQVAAAAAGPEREASATEHTVVRPRPLVPMPRAADGPQGGEVEAKTPSLWWRFMTASILIVISSATAVALATLLRVTEVAAQLDPIRNVQDKLAAVEPGEPQTILILGSDERSNTPGDPGRSDTTMLLRVDAENDVLSLFSLPRDLKVDIPGIGPSKLNEAFTAGGAPLTLETVKNLTGLEISHVVNVDFQGFADAVDAIGCVYIDVDRDYFNDNSQAFSEAEKYATINVNAGYQRLCGLNALDYVRYRHTDTDIVRGARQQDFLSEARARVPVSEVLPLIGGDTGGKLLDIFTEYTDSDLGEGSAGEVINILKSFVNVVDVPVKEVHFDGNLGRTYVTASPEQIKKAVQEFLGQEDSAGPRGGENANVDPDPEPAEEKDKKKSDPTQDANVLSTEDAAAAMGLPDKFAAFGRTSARRLKFPVYVPKLVAPGSIYDKGSRQYEIKDIDENKQPAYKMVIQLTDPDSLPEYYGIEGTTWENPPILENPSETSREIDGREFDLYYDGDRLGMVAWHDGQSSYWVRNTLLQTLDEDEMLAIAASTEEAKD